MSTRAILLRLLLCIALVFNGAASAMASVQMMQMHADGQGTASIPVPTMADAEPAMPCHHDGQASHSQDAADAATPSKDKQPHQAPDCCKSSTCTCACVHQAAAMVPMMAFQGAALLHAGSVRSMALGHPAPALPHLIRPPIG
jgi:hypothetical protein